MLLNSKSLDGFDLDEKMLHYIESLLATKIIVDNIVETTIESVKAERWYGNFYGLLSNELGISSNALYIHLRINGYRLNTDYKANKNIKILEPEVFGEIIDTYERDNAYRKSLNNG